MTLTRQIMLTLLKGSRECSNPLISTCRRVPDGATRARRSPRDIQKDQQRNRLAHRFRLQRIKGQMGLARRDSRPTAATTFTTASPAISHPRRSNEPAAISAAELSPHATTGLSTIPDKRSCSACSCSPTTTGSTSGSKTAYAFGHHEPTLCERRLHNVVASVPECLRGAEYGACRACFVLLESFLAFGRFWYSLGVENRGGYGKGEQNRKMCGLVVSKWSISLLA